MKNKTIFILTTLIVMLTFSSCYTKKQAIAKFCNPLLVKDSFNLITNVKDSIVKKDSTVFIPKFYTNFELDNLCDSLGKAKDINFTTGTGNNTASVEIKNNKLKVKCNCDSAIQVLKSIIKSHNKKSVTKQKTTTVTQAPAKPVHWLKQFQAWSIWFWWIGLFTIAFFILWIIKKFV